MSNYRHLPAGPDYHARESRMMLRDQQPPRVTVIGSMVFAIIGDVLFVGVVGRWCRRANTLTADLDRR